MHLRRRSRLWLLILLGTLLILVVYARRTNKDAYIQFSPENSTNEGDQDRNDILDDPLVQYLQQKSSIKDDRGIDAHSSVYDQIFQSHRIGSVLLNLDFHERCELYFKNLQISNPEWKLDPDAEIPYQDGDRLLYNYEAFKEEAINDLISEFSRANEIPKHEISEELPQFEQFVRFQFNANWNGLMNIEQRVTDYISTLRVFNKCYLPSDKQQSQRKFIRKQKKLINLGSIPSFQQNEQEATIEETNCQKLEARVYPWLSRQYPTYTRWSGESFTDPEQVHSYLTSEKYNPLGQESCFLAQLKHSYLGKGLVATISDKHVDDMVRLIHNLRALNNKLPIQIVYYESLSQESKQKIIQAAQSTFTNLPKSFDKVAKYFPSDYGKQEGGLQKQEIWFVNADTALVDKYKNKFKGFGNKFLALLFSTFKETILLDADAVLFQPPESFFKLKGYKKTGTYFFKDRGAGPGRPLSDRKFFKKLSPSIIDSLMFDIPIMTNKTLNSRFFHGFEHNMEAGLVVMDKYKHFDSMLMMHQFQILEPTRNRVYGDKEIFWLAMSANGVEDYTLNKYFAAAVGEVTDTQYWSKPDGSKPKAIQVCSSHPGHINGEDGKTLLWINSGMEVCKYHSVLDYDAEMPYIKDEYHFSPESLREIYKSPLVIDSAVIPPEYAERRTNIENEPEFTWDPEGPYYCSGCIWCAYSQIGGLQADGSDNTLKGRFIKFDKKQRDLFKYYGDIWTGSD